MMICYISYRNFLLYVKIVTNYKINGNYYVQVALYKYSATQEWEKTETEGTLFVYERKCEPTYGFLILNRLSTNNWIQPISSDIDSQLQAPFLLYKTKVWDDFGQLHFIEQRNVTI